MVTPVGTAIVGMQLLYVKVAPVHSTMSSTVTNKQLF